MIALLYNYHNNNGVDAIDIIQRTVHDCAITESEIKAIVQIKTIPLYSNACITAYSVVQINECVLLIAILSEGARVTEHPSTTSCTCTTTSVPMSIAYRSISTYMHIPVVPVTALGV